MENKTKIMIVAIVVAALVAASVAVFILALNEDENVEPWTSLRLATTTSTQDSGLLDYILPTFEDQYNCDVLVIAVGSGQAMELGKRGDVDVLLVHSPSAEQQFVSGGYGTNRTQVMYNSFVIVGPLADPAGTANATNATDAFQRIYDNRTSGDIVFVSRADTSGTHTKELSFWSKLGLNASQFSNDWYKATGLGMGAVLDMCEEMDAYTLSDDATYYSRVDVDLIPHLNITYAGDSALRNQYSVIAVNGTMWPHVNRTMALNFTEWITCQSAQDLIASYVKYGHQLFFPNAPGYSTTSISIVRSEGWSSSPMATCRKG